MHVEKRQRWFVGTLLAALSLAVAACGATPTETGLGDALPAANETTVVSTALATVAPAATHPTNISAQVALMPGASHYATSDSINIVIRNTSGQTIYAIAHFTDCSIISLEHLVGSGWQSVNLCSDGYPHLSISHITPGANVMIQMTPTSASSSAQASSTSRWPAGTYRSALTYTSSASAAFSAGTTVFSTQFIVG